MFNFITSYTSGVWVQEKAQTLTNVMFMVCLCTSDLNIACTILYYTKWKILNTKNKKKKKRTKMNETEGNYNRNV